MSIPQNVAMQYVALSKEFGSRIGVSPQFGQLSASF
ncbi:hypothetical protein ABIE33_000547 [Ensifer sp. 4252]